MLTQRQIQMRGVNTFVYSIVTFTWDLVCRKRSRSLSTLYWCNWITGPAILVGFRHSGVSHWTLNSVGGGSSAGRAFDAW